MSVSIDDNNVTVTVSQDVQIDNNVVTGNITNEYPNTITVKSNEYAIVGDGLFATTKEEVPAWMKTLVNDLATSATASAYNAMTGFNYNLYNALISLQVAENKYQQSINTRITDQEAFVQAVETLNSTAQNAQAEIVSIKQTYATKDFAVATVAETLEASINGGAIKSSIGALASSMSNQYGTMAQRMDVLESTFENLESGVEGYANATHTLETYVGSVDSSQGAAGTYGLSKNVTDLELKLDDLDNSIYGTSGLKQTLEGVIDKEGARVESKFAYNSNIVVNGVAYSSGFGLTSTGTQAGTYTEDGVTYPKFNSEFWINAEKFKFTNSTKSGSVAPFTIDASGTTPQIKFNGIVEFNNISSRPTHTSGTLANRPSIAVLGSSYVATNENNKVYTYTSAGWIVGGVTSSEVVAAINGGNTTTINGGRITTGSINVMDAAVGNVISSGNYVPDVSGWSINRNGNAEMNNVRIRGDVSSTGALQSSTYVAGSTGWIISGNGSAEFNNIRLRINLSSVVTVPTFNPGTRITNSWLSVGSWTINPPDVIGGGYVTASFSISGYRTEGSYLDLNARLWINGVMVAQVYNGGSATASVTVSGGLGYRVDYPVMVNVEVYSYVYNDGIVNSVSGSITNAA